MCAHNPGCIAENGFVLGVNDACDNFDINTFEPLDEALLKCADLYIEAPKYEVIKKASAYFLEICSRFGLTKPMAFDECLLEVEDLPETDVHTLVSAIRHALLDELKTESDIQVYNDFAERINQYSASVKRSDFALEILAAMLNFKLAVDSSCAKMFSMEIVDTNGVRHTADRRVDVPCSDYSMILFILKNMLDITVTAQYITVNLYDIQLKQDSTIHAETKKDNPHKKMTWDYTKQNKHLYSVLNRNELYVYSKLCDYIKDNPDGFGFYDLVALAEKANTRRLKLGNYFINPAYAEKFVKQCSVFSRKGAKILINGYCPLMLLFAINEHSDAELYYSNLDERTLNLINLLEEYSPYKTLEIKPAVDADYDVALSCNVQKKHNAKTEILLVKKTFFASSEKDEIKHSRISGIYDFGSFGFIGTFDQYAALVVEKDSNPGTTKLYSLDNDSVIVQNQNYITDDSLPCWVLYRNKQFDSVYSKLRFDLFDVKCSTQIKQRDYKTTGDICVISAACIDSDGNVHIDESCRHVTSADISNYDIAGYAERDDVLFSAATSSVLKVARKPKGCVPNQSTVLLIPKNDIVITNRDLDYFLSDEFRNFYNVALNHQNFILSKDHLSQYFLGKAVS